MKLVIEIDCNHAAFEDGAFEECWDILTRWAQNKGHEQFQRLKDVNSTATTLRDYNGNTVGFARVEK